ncbi:hypothetical protein CCYS_00250 [Corynebacterium cystitidis DSM 20524]|uniref:Transposase n=1 Tax=Corynebacterium cystitidis DSM 20524 TaxID=1121357 RepID=A0A1H9UMS6_9CORY|nr:hypothetical protein CCYS_00250 [Corynebacterium cystitidis DSM 20524]SES10504.1 hypothetical protein SAMN05661109_01877 [Corynebacterium cystitidis DSM 20524]SNV90529.1 transposase IS3504a [Corynebacterium cystitidis]
MQAACQAVAPKFGISWHTARQWVQKALGEGQFPHHLPDDLAAENARLRREVQELRDTNELLNDDHLHALSEHGDTAAPVPGTT